MQVILLEKITNLGSLGDVVKVKDGFARNYLIPQGKAKRATPENVKLLEEKRAELERLQADKFTVAQALAEKINGLMVQITQRAGVDGHLFGSVTNVDICEALRAQGHIIEKSQVRMPAGPIKQIGDHSITLSLHTDVTATITVSVLGEVTN